jgi:hypothetical protein
MRQEPVLAARTIPGHNPRVNLTMRVVGGLHHIASNHAPYFTLTVDTHRKGHPNQCQSGGCDRATILKYYPKFADLAALHLSDIDGVPMYAESNGWYDLAGYLPAHAGQQYHAGNSERHFPKPEGAPRRGDWDTTDYRKPTPEECLQIFADHIRVNIEMARELARRVIEYAETHKYPVERVTFDPAGVEVPETEERNGWKAARAEVFAPWIEARKPEWKAQADACIKTHGLRVFGDPWPAATEAA